MRKILFVCSGNTCRSPMARGLAEMKMGEKWSGEVSFDSAGTMALDGGRASKLAVDVMSDIGIDLGDHRSKRLTRDLADSADIIMAMDSNHLESILTIDSGYASKIILPVDLDSDREVSGVEDPLGKERDVYVRVRDELDNLTDRLEDYLAESMEADNY